MLMIGETTVRLRDISRPILDALVGRPVTDTEWATFQKYQALEEVDESFDIIEALQHSQRTYTFTCSTADAYIGENPEPVEPFYRKFEKRRFRK